MGWASRERKDREGEVMEGGREGGEPIAGRDKKERGGLRKHRLAVSFLRIGFSKEMHTKEMHISHHLPSRTTSNPLPDVPLESRPFLFHHLVPPQNPPTPMLVLVLLQLLLLGRGAKSAGGGGGKEDEEED